jgi:hypothetical protein
MGILALTEILNKYFGHILRSPSEFRCSTMVFDAMMSWYGLAHTNHWGTLVTPQLLYQQWAKPIRAFLQTRTEPTWIVILHDKPSGRVPFKLKAEESKRRSEAKQRAVARAASQGKAAEPEIGDDWKFNPDGYWDPKSSSKVTLPVYALCKNKRRFAEFLDYLFEAITTDESWPEHARFLLSWDRKGVGGAYHWRPLKGARFEPEFIEDDGYFESDVAVQHWIKWLRAHHADECPGPFQASAGLHISSGVHRRADSRVVRRS